MNREYKTYKLSIKDVDLYTVKGRAVTVKDILDPVPVEIRVRLMLNEAGFKFEDDGKPSAINNLKPMPLGILYTDYDQITKTTHYKQIV